MIGSVIKITKPSIDTWGLFIRKTQNTVLRRAKDTFNTVANSRNRTSVDIKFIRINKLEWEG